MKILGDLYFLVYIAHKAIAESLEYSNGEKNHVRCELLANLFWTCFSPSLSSIMHVLYRVTSFPGFLVFFSSDLLLQFLTSYNNTLTFALTIMPCFTYHCPTRTHTFNNQIMEQPEHTYNALGSTKSKFNPPG